MIFLTLDAERLELRGFIIKLLLDSIPLRIQSMLNRLIETALYIRKLLWAKGVLHPLDDHLRYPSAGSGVLPAATHAR